MEQWSERLRQARISKGLSQQQVANELGVTRACYAHYEQGVREPPYALLKPICQFLDISSDYLLGIIDNY